MRIKFSPSSIGTFLECSQKYYFQYEDRYVKQHRQEFDRPSPALVVGQTVHIALSRYFGYPADQRGWALLGGLLRGAWGKPHGERDGFVSIEAERQAYAEALDMLRRFLVYEEQRHTVAYTGDPEHQEALLQRTINPNLILIGRVDRVDREPDGLHVIDYKTGRHASGELQLMIYTMLAEVALQTPVVRASYFYLQRGELETIDPDDTRRREVVGRIDHTVAAIRRQSWTPNVSMRCSFCPFIKLCPAGEQAKELLANGGAPTHNDFFEG